MSGASIEIEVGTHKKVQAKNLMMHGGWKEKVT